MINLIAMDVYDGTPTIVTVWLTIVVKLTILIFLLSIIEYSIPDFSSIYNSINIFNSASNIASDVPLVDAGESNSFYSGVPAFVGELIDKEEIKNLFLISSLLSLLIGTVAGLSQIKFKRLLAFSSISHVGFLLLALGVYTQKSIDSFIFYLLQYSVTSLNIFLILLAFSYFIIMPTKGITTFSSLLPDKSNASCLRYQNKEESISATLATYKKDLNDNVGSLTDINYIVELKGQIYKNPVLSISMAICLFSMAGVPPLIGFFSKQFVLFSSIENGYNFISIVAILVSVISASYYLKLIKITFFDYLPSLKKNTIYFLHSAQGHNAVATSAQQEADQKQDKIWFLCAVSEVHSYIVAILTFLILFFFLDPSILLNVTQLISLTIFNI